MDEEWFCAITCCKLKQGKWSWPPIEKAKEKGVTYATFRIAVAANAGLLGTVEATDEACPRHTCDVFKYCDGRVDATIEAILVRLRDFFFSAFGA